MKSLTLPATLLLVQATAAHAAVVNVLPGVNNVPITQVVYNDGTNDIVQTSPASGVENTSDTPLSVKSVQINNGGTLINLEYINTDGATVLNINPEFENIGGTSVGTGVNGIGVFDNGTNTLSKDNLVNFSNALAATTIDTDLRNFIFYDYLDSTPSYGTPDFDIVYNTAMNLDDYVLISERNGNTYFEVTPLKADGTPYENANVLRFGGDGGLSYEVYDWNSGYAASSNQPTQAQAFTVASVAAFFEGTTATPGPVWGFRIDNDGEADTKIVVMSNDTFTNNPTTTVPEPSTFLASLLAPLLMVLRRRRN
ncbi:MAG: hypothetical protein ACQCXQ_15005 [Verrucomicrobiales bacterium]|nr:hypothetical protein [Verrucomicrobiota bacterium JB025]